MGQEKVRVAFIAFDCIRLGFLKGIYDKIKDTHNARCFVHYGDAKCSTPHTVLKWMDFDLKALWDFSPNYIVMFNGFATQTLPVTNLIRSERKRAHGINVWNQSVLKEVFHVEQGWLPQKGNIYIDRLGIGGSTEIYAGKATNEIAACDGFKWGERITKLKDLYEPKPRTDSCFSHLPKKYILVPMQLEHDTSIVYDSDRFKTMASVVRYAHRMVKNDPEVKLVVKKHPRDKKLDLSEFNINGIHIEQDLSVNDLIGLAMCQFSNLMECVIS